MAIDWPARDLPADEPASVETGPVEVSPVDAPTVDAPMVFDAPVAEGPSGERPTPVDGVAAACTDHVLSYADLVMAASGATVTSLSFSFDGGALAASIDHNYVVWPVPGGGVDGGVRPPSYVGVDGGTCSGRAVRTCPAAIKSIAYLPDGRLAGLYCAGIFIIFGCETMPDFMGAFAVSPVGSLVADTNTPIRLWDTWTAQQVRTFASGGASTLAFSPDGAVLVGGIKGGGVRAWDVGSGAELTTLPVTAAVGDSVLVRISPDGRWLGALYAGKVQLWSLRTYAAVATFPVDPLATDFAFTRDGNSVITGGAHTNVYAVRDGSLQYQMGDRTYVVAVSPDGTRVAASGSPGVPVNLYCLY